MVTMDEMIREACRLVAEGPRIVLDETMPKDAVIAIGDEQVVCARGGLILFVGKDEFRELVGQAVDEVLDDVFATYREEVVTR